MRAIRRVLSLAVFLFVTASVASAADPYAEYRIPAHNWHSWSANLSGSGNHDVRQVFSGFRSTSGELNGALASRYDGGFDSDPGSGAYGLELRVSGGRLHTSSEQVDLLQTDESTGRRRNLNESIQGFFGFARYPWSAPLGFSIASQQQLGLSQSWSSNGRIQISPPFEVHSANNATTGAYGSLLALVASVNWGRVRDATPVCQVQVLEQRLLQEGAISHALSPAARERLAALYTVEGRLSFAHQRPTKYFWGELERLLREDDVLSERGLDAYTVQRLLEPLSIAGKPIARTRGYSIGPQVQLRSTQIEYGTKAVVSSAFFENDSLLGANETTFPRSKRYRRDDFILSGMFVDYHRPFGMHWQADGTTRALVSESGERVELATVLRGTWIVTDRWLGTGFFNHSASAPGEGWDRTVERWNIEYGASVSYFFEDSWAFTLGAQQQQTHAPDNFLRHEFFSLGVTYQVSGLLNAPGVFAPMRLTPPAR